MFKLASFVRPNILSMKAYSSARSEFDGKEAVFLDANENPYGLYNRYPDPKQTALRQKLSDIKGLSMDNMVLGNGSDEILDLIFRLFCIPGKDKVLSLDPSYGMYDVGANLNDIQHIKFPLDKEGNFDTSDLLTRAEAENVKMLLLCSPNNPMGNILPGIETILENFNGLVLIDEAYIDFCPEHSWIKGLERYPNLMIMQTLSKAWGMAALRIGILMASKEIIALVNRIKPPYNISLPTQQLALDGISNKQGYEDNKQRIIEERERMFRILCRMDMVKRVYPSVTNFILFTVEEPYLVYNTLRELGIVIRNRDSQVKGGLRISVGSQKENDLFIKELIKLENEKNLIYR